MPGAFFGLEIGSRALHAFQTALDVTAHNVANVGTRGYSRQRAAFTQVHEGQAGSFNLGGGVRTETIMRVRDLFLDRQARSAGSENSRLTTLNQQLGQVEAIMAESGSTGLGSKLDNLFNAFQQLSVHPEDPATRSYVLSAASGLASEMRSLHVQLAQVDSDLSTQISTSVSTVDALTGQIAKLNEQIAVATATGSAPNDLLDQRDSLIEDLSSIVDVDVRPGANGTVDVFAGEAVLVRASESHPMPAVANLPNIQLTDGLHRISLEGGVLAGLMQAQSRIQSYNESLDALAGSLIERVNAVHQGGRTLNGATGTDFFTGSSALDIAVSAAALSDPRNIAAGASNTPGDGTQALAMAHLRDEVQNGLGGRTFSGYYGNLVTSIGSDISTNQAAIATQSAVLDQIDSMRQSVAGVSLDEEMANMMNYQRSYQAAARMITVFDQMIQDTIESLGR